MKFDKSNLTELITNANQAIAIANACMEEDDMVLPLVIKDIKRVVASVIAGVDAKGEYTLTDIEERDLTSYVEAYWA
jgi:hypothetical protein